MRDFVFCMFAICALLTTAAAAETQHSSPQALPPIEYQKYYFKSGDSYIAGQPSEAAIRQLRQQNVTAVVNLRTTAEMIDKEQVPFDEAELANSLGLDYVHIPLNGKKGYSTSALNEFIAAYDEHEGKILLHCRSAKRASQIWAAFLIKHQGMTKAEALKIARSINLGDATLNGLLGAVGTTTETKRL